MHNVVLFGLLEEDGEELNDKVSQVFQSIGQKPRIETTSIHKTSLYFIYLTVTKINQERTNQERTKIGRFVDFLLHFSIFLLEIFSIASQLSCEAMINITIKNIKFE